MRTLKVKDAIFVGEVLKNNLDELSAMNFSELKEGESVEDKNKRVGLMVLKIVLADSYKDICDWFASICELTPEEFADKDLNYLYEVYEHLTNIDFKSFLSNAADIKK